MPRLDASETIAAIASPPGPAIRGIVRLSGTSAPEIASAAFSRLPSRDPARGPRRVVGALRVSGLGASVPASLLTWRGERSYTGQPLAEIHTVGATPILDALLADCLARGARLAERGEFTLRAFLSGRLDLTQAEAVLGVIEARAPGPLKAALRQLAGGIAGPIGRLRDRLLDVLAHLEANLDFVDESDVDPLARESLAAELAGASADLALLAARLRDRDRPAGLPRVVLAGPPNAGKSTLFNALAEEDRALVSSVAGTTRDYLCVEILCEGWPIELIDTAGEEHAADEIRLQAQALRAEQVEGADLVVLCRPASETASHIEPEARPGWLHVATKCDLGGPHVATGAVRVSAESAEGLDALRSAIVRRLAAAEGEESSVAGTSARCRDALGRAGHALQSASDALRLGLGDELVAVDLRQALDDLGRVVGAIVTEDVLDRIFRRFCIGK